MEALKKFWEAWQKFGQFIGNIVGRVILSLFYFTIMLPFSLGVTLFSDALDIKSNPSKFWVNRQSFTDSMEQAHRQF